MKVATVGVRSIGVTSTLDAQKVVVVVEEIDDITLEDSTHKLRPRLIDIPFMPRAKHCKKGHERKYKFHK